MYDFIAMELNDRVRLLWDKGIFLASVTDKEHGYALYALADFYVEVKVHGELDEITEITPFKQGHRLDKYLEVITFEK